MSTRIPPIDDEAPTLDAPAPRSVDVPERIGPYRLLERIGMGGMGDVWLAEQTKPIQRKVALKLIRGGFHRGEIVARFESERQALALMDHPAIARVFDAGTSDDGRPYFAMEYVPGEPITDYCDRAKATNRERLELMIDVCRGVQHAHQKAVIHRDLKPSNILVREGEARPQPKIIDFGIAKAIGQKLTDHTMHTQVGQFVGTLDYMSPEQADPSQHGIDTRSDVYALGVVLYQLLTSTLPFDAEEMRQVSREEACRRIREEDPPRPSTRVSSLGADSTQSAANRRTDVALMTKELRGDLDWIVLKALEKDRTRRYSSPDALAADLQRFLHHEPVVARPPSAAYRAQKFVRRHRVGVAFAAVLAAAAMALVVTTLVQNRRIAAERDRANREAQAANAALDFMTDLFNISDPSEARGNSVTAREVLDRGAEKIETAFEDAPEVRARMMGTMGRVYESLGLYEPAEKALETALRLQREEPGADTVALAKSISDLGWLQRERGDFPAAERSFQEAHDMLVRELGEDHLDVATQVTRLGIVHADLAEYDEALELKQRAFEIGERNDTDRLSYTQNLANAYADLGRPNEALPLYERILERRLEIYGGDHVDVAFAHDNLALVLFDLERFDDAETHHVLALEMLERVFGPEHPEVAQTLGNLSAFYFDRGKLEEAEPLARRAVKLAQGVLGDGHHMTADHLSTLADVLLAQGDVAGAVEAAREVLPIFRRALPEDHPKLTGGLALVGRVRQAQGRFGEAEELLLEAYRRKVSENREAEEPMPVDELEPREELLALFAAMGEEERGRRLLAEIEKGN